VRADIAALPSPEQRMAAARQTASAGGGRSLGAAALNDAVPQALALIAEADRPSDPSVRCQELDKLSATMRCRRRADARAFIDDMAQAYAWCDVIMCRAGALTLAEVTAAGVASVLVPYRTQSTTTRPATPAS